MFKKSSWTDKLNLNYIIVAVMLGLAIFGYGFMTYKTKQNELQLRRDELKLKEDVVAQETKEKLSKARLYVACESEANSNSSAVWDSACKDSGLKEDCRLPRYEADGYEEARQNALARCVQLYK